MKPIFWCCATCKLVNWNAPSDQPLSCAAFPGGIPKEISQEGFDHREPFPGDNGIRYEPLPGTDIKEAFSSLDLINKQDTEN